MTAVTIFTITMTASLAVIPCSQLMRVYMAAVTRHIGTDHGPLTPDQHIPQGSSGSAPHDRLAERPPTPGGVYGQLSLLESIGAFVGTANQEI